MAVMNVNLTSSVSTAQTTYQKDEEKLKRFSEALEDASKTEDAKKLKTVTQQFEAFFINEIFKSMRKSSSFGEGILEKSHARSVYESMSDEKMADKISQGQGIGLADMMYKQMIKQYNIVENENPNKNTEDDSDNDDESTSTIDLKL